MAELAPILSLRVLGRGLAHTAQLTPQYRKNTWWSPVKGSYCSQGIHPSLDSCLQPNNGTDMAVERAAS